LKKREVPAAAGLRHTTKTAKVHIRLVIVFSLFSAIVLLAGCSASSPRFGAHERRTPPPAAAAPRFAAKEAQEERAEDDRKVDRKDVERVIGGKRDYTQEKNTSIKPLDESRMMREISKYMGVAYKSGGTSEDGMDCSGYTQTVYKNSIGVQLPRTSSEQSQTGASVDLKDLKFGDLIFFNTTGDHASHVGIYLGDDLFAHASVTLGVTISSLQSSYFQKRYESARRIVGK